MNLLSLLAR